MINQLRDIGNIYDLVALCSSYILNEIGKKPYEFGTFQEEEFNFVWDAVENYCFEKSENGHLVAFKRLREQIIRLMAPEPSLEKCFAVIKSIDELVEVELNGMLMGGNHIISYQALNVEYVDKVRILPKRLESIHDRGDERLGVWNSDEFHTLFRKRRECACSELDKEMANYMVWDEACVKTYPLQVYRLDEEHPATKHFRETGEVIFGLVPFTSIPLQSIFDLKFKGKTFYIEGMHAEPEKELRKCYEMVCRKSREEGIDFLVFPEMMMTENILLRDNALLARERKKERKSSFIINGTIWKDFANQSIVTEGNGEKIFSYYKKEPYILERNGIEYREFLDKEKNKSYVIMEIEGVGRIGIGICRDLISEKVKLFHKHMGTDILFIPACTDSRDMLASAEELSKEYNCIVVLANTCSAFGQELLEHGDKMLSFITLPAKNGSTRAVVLRPYYSCGCCENCARGCTGMKVCVDFLHVEHYDSGLSYKIVESFF